MAAQAQPIGQSSGDTVKTVQTTTTVQHINGRNEVWYKEGGVVPAEYRGDTYAVQQWKNEHLNEPVQGSHWIRGDNGDFLLVDNNSGMITSISRQH
ncbi:RcnB family protein [Dyella sp. 2YAF14]|uniref:RcnB family protein n=1 Tax=Dyella sp. 2YAF14 TaxID=3233025 RepID=UPI003F8E1D37